MSRFLNNGMDDPQKQMLALTMARLGGEQELVFEMLDMAGFASVISFARDQIFNLVQSRSAYDELKEYWREYACERLSSLGGPVSILKGEYPYSNSYRSELIANLRNTRHLLPVPPPGVVVTPHIEPTLKLVAELPGELQTKLFEARKRCYEAAAEEYVLTVRGQKFSSRSAEKLALYSIYDDFLIPEGFVKGKLYADGCVYRKPSGFADLDFILIDESKRNLWLTQLTVSLAIAKSDRLLIPGKSFGSCLVSFSPDDLIPKFGELLNFDSRNFSQLIYSASAIASLTVVISNILRDYSGVVGGAKNVD